MHGAYDDMVSNAGGTRNTLYSAICRCLSLVARNQPFAGRDAQERTGNLRKDHQRPERKLTNQSVAIGEDRVSQKGRVMFKKKQHIDDEALLKKANKKLDRAADKAVKEAKNTQDVIIANGFTLELLIAMGGKAKHD